MTSLVFIRHAETDLAGTFCGHSNPSINVRGRKQVSNLIATPNFQSFDAIYSSDLLRALETARALAHTSNLPIETNAKLREIFFGEWESLTWAEIEERDADLARRWIQKFPTLSAPNGEDYTDFEARVLEVCDQLLALGKGGRVAVITHGGVMRVALRHLLGYNEQEAWELTKAYCSSFVYTGKVLERELTQ